MIGMPRSILPPAALGIAVLFLATLLAACSGDDNILRLTDSDDYDGAPAWSPDGREKRRRRLERRAPDLLRRL